MCKDMIWKTAWKNVWRNKVRSLVVIISVTIGIFGGIFAVAVMNGAIEQRVDAALNDELAHIHINDPAFRDNYDIQLTLPNPDKLIKTIDETPGVKVLTPRIIITGMANTATKSAGVQILGVDPEREKEVFGLYETTLPETGDFFESESRHLLAYIGHELAKELNIIRFRIDNLILDSLAAKELPPGVLAKLTPLKDIRFKSEKAFKKEVKKVLSLKEQHSYGRLIRDEAWTFRPRSKMTLTFLDKDQIQTGAVFRIAGVYDIKNSMYEMSQVLVKNEDLINLTGLWASDCHQLIVRL